MNKSNSETDGLLKISEVAEAAGVSLSTIKHYVKEGLIEVAFKTGKTMAYYAPESVERIKLIRALQNEKFYPLAVIKHMLGNKAAESREFKLLDVINKADKAGYNEQMPFTEAIKEANLKPREAEALVQARLIVPVTVGHSRMCTRGDCHLMKLVKMRMQANIPLEQTIITFSLYETALLETTRKDVESLVRRSLLAKSLSAEEIMDLISASDETLDSFIGMKRYAMNASLGAEYIAKAEKLLSQLKAYVNGFLEILNKLTYNETAAKLKDALEGGNTSDQIFTAYSEMLFIDGSGLANILSVLYRESKLLKEATPRTGCCETDMEHDALLLGWATFAPEEFDCEPLNAKENFMENTPDKALSEEVLQLIDKLRR